MPRFTLWAACLLAAAAWLGGARPATAQPFSFGGNRELAVQSLSFGYSLINFEFDGNEQPLFSFNFNEPAYGLVYTRPNFMVTLAVGDQQAGGDKEALRLLDVSLSTWGELNLPGPSTGETRLFVPIILYSNYRRVSPEGGGDALLDAFNVTVLGLGAGLGLNQPLGETALFEARVHPIIGLASSSLADALGSARLVEANTQLHLGQLFNRFGLSVGYTFRVQVWNVNASEIFPDFTDDLFDYRGRHHLFRVGVNW